MLYLFDIDGTLVDTGGAGMAALEEATREIFGAAGPPLDLAGATDLGIVIGIHEHFSLEPTRESIDVYLAIYQQRLDWNLAHGGFPGRVLDGASGLIRSGKHVGFAARTRKRAVDCKGGGSGRPRFPVL